MLIASTRCTIRELSNVPDQLDRRAFKEDAPVFVLCCELVNNEIAGRSQALSSEPLVQVENAWLAKCYGNLSNFLKCQKLRPSSDNRQEALIYHDRFDETKSKISGLLTDAETHAENELRALFYGYGNNYPDIFGFKVSSDCGRQEARRYFRDPMYKDGQSQS
jgi:hypothetical protein